MEAILVNYSAVGIPYGLPTADHSGCPYGRAFLGILTIPSMEARAADDIPLESNTLAINLFYGLVPLIYSFFMLFHLCTLIVLKYPHDDEGLREQDLECAESRNDRIMSLLQAFEFAVFLLLTTMISVLLQLGVNSPRPLRSCLERGGMPEGRTVWAIGMITLHSLRALQKHALPFLHALQRVETTAQQALANGADKRVANLAQAMMDGCLVDTTALNLDMHIQPLGQLFFTILELLVVFAPVPMSAIILEDATFGQVVIGCIVGIVVGAAVHIFTTYLQTRSQWLWDFSTYLVRQRGCVVPPRIATVLQCSGGLFKCTDCVSRTLKRVPGFEFLGFDSKDLRNLELQQAKLLNFGDGDLSNDSTDIENMYGHWAEALASSEQDSEPTCTAETATSAAAEVFG